MTADLVKIDAAAKGAAKDKMTLVSASNESTKDKMTFPEESNCPLRKGQNDPIKDNTNKIKLKDKEEIDELPFATLQADSSIS